MSGPVSETVVSDVTVFSGSTGWSGRGVRLTSGLGSGGVVDLTGSNGRGSGRTIVVSMTRAGAVGATSASTRWS